MSLLPQSAGYATILAGGAFFAILMNGATWIQRRYTQYNPSRIEEFSSASRSVKTGCRLASPLPGSGQPFSSKPVHSPISTASLSHGGLAWAALNCCIRFYILKGQGQRWRRFDVAKVRFGTLGHFAFIFAAVVANFVVGSEILIGGAGVITGMTGISEYAGIWLLPTVIVLYVLTGGLRATFVADYLHCCILFTCLLVLMLATYTRGDEAGSPGRLWQLLKAASEVGRCCVARLMLRQLRSLGMPIIRTYRFEAMAGCTMRSYWQRSIASRPAGTSKAFIFAGCFFFSIAFGIGSSMGLAARALESNPAFPTYPNPMSLAEIGAGLAGPYASKVILGKAGPAMYTIIAFMATTSAFSAQLVAVSTIAYREYFNKAATNKQMMRVNHAVVIFWAIFMAGINSVFAHIGLNLNFLFYFMAICTSGSVFPIGLLMCWTKLNKLGAITGVFGGLAMGFIGWLISAWKLEGSITTTTLTASKVILTGSLAALGAGAIFSIGISLIRPDAFDFERTRAIGSGKLRHPAAPTSQHVDSPHADEKEIPATDSSEYSYEPALTAVEGGGRTLEANEEYKEGVRKLEASQTKFRIITCIFLFIILVLIPVPLAGTGVVYTKSLFTLQCVAAAAFVFISTILVIFWPLVESSKEIGRICRRIANNDRLDVDKTTSE
ncbi:uncharacterized protein L203_106448 [Cryptococcus depauperatus CBS 7841]|uniref:Uncharacterized protein n=1 Tax=Cryptococcus depauperatus CBS 7841 TaxID=1295531 RepID=A0AAJ8JZ04_9TREE